MFGIINRKKKDNKNENIIYTIEGTPVFNQDTGEFYGDFSQEQKRMLLLFIEHKVSISAFAYPSMTMEELEWIRKAILPMSADGRQYVINLFDEEILYKITHTDFDEIEQFAACLYGMNWGLDMCGNIKGIAGLPSDMLIQIAKLGKMGVDVISQNQIHPGMDILDIYDFLDEKEKEAVQKQKELEKRTYKAFDLLR